MPNDHVDDLKRATERYRKAKKQLDSARAELINALRAAHDDGMRQANMVRAIDHEWTREYVGKVVATTASTNVKVGNNEGTV